MHRAVSAHILPHTCWCLGLHRTSRTLHPYPYTLVPTPLFLHLAPSTENPVALETLSPSAPLALLDVPASPSCFPAPHFFHVSPRSTSFQGRLPELFDGCHPSRDRPMLQPYVPVSVLSSTRECTLHPLTFSFWPTDPTLLRSSFSLSLSSALPSELCPLMFLPLSLQLFLLFPPLLWFLPRSPPSVFLFPGPLPHQEPGRNGALGVDPLEAYPSLQP